VNNKKVERWFAATEVSTGREGREIHKEYCSLYAWLILCHAAVKNIHPNRTHQHPIHSIYVLTPTGATQGNCQGLHGPRPHKFLTISQLLIGAED
jgi:hypothetical protein